MSQLKKMTKLGSDTRKIAALLQAKAPKGEMLAYISPQEAALLRARGGSGKPHADTGIPSFAEEGDFDFSSFGRAEPDTTVVPGSAMYMEGGPAADYGMGQFEPSPTSAISGGGIDPAAIAATAQARPGAEPFVPPAVTQPIGGMGAAVPAAVSESPAFTPSAYGRTDVAGLSDLAPGAPTGPIPGREAPSGGLMSALGLNKADPLKLGLAGLQVFMGSQQARQAAEQGRAARAEMQAMAAPYQQQGKAIQAQAARGELTPQAQQSLQAVQAQLAQGAQARGGVGAAQIAGQVEAVRQQLLQSQADYGLKLSGIGDQIALGAIRAGIQADQYVNSLTNSYMGNIMRLYGGMPMIIGGTNP